MPKTPGEWTEDDLLSLCREGVEERQDLEYKRCASLQKRDEQRREISKDVSAMANSAGGTIIYGIIEDGHVPKGLDVGFDPTDITKEWLEHVILGTIRPRLNGVAIHPINLISHAPDKVAYAVYVPQSHTAHQALDKKYYKRFNFEATAMDDYEIRDIMNRLKHPVLVPQFTRQQVSNSGDIREFLLNIILKNEGAVRANDIGLVITIPTRLSKAVHGVRQRPIKLPPGIFGDTWFENSFRSSAFVIFPGDEWNANEAAVRFVIIIDSRQIDRNETRGPFLYWKIFANDMSAMLGSVFLGDVPIV